MANLETASSLSCMSGSRRRPPNASQETVCPSSRRLCMARRMNKLGTMLQVGRTFGVRDGMLRLEYELQRGSGLMSWRMRSVQGWDSWGLKKIAPESSPEELRTSRRDGTRKFLFADALALGTNIRRVIGTDGEPAVLEEAERILAGRLPFFGQLSLACHFPPRWFQNPV